MQKSFLRWSLIGIPALFCVCMLDSRFANAQFLEKLEAAVRAQLDTAQQPTQGEPAQSKSAQGKSALGKSALGELPPPKVAGPSAGETPAGLSLPSILEPAQPEGANFVPSPFGTPAVDDAPADSGSIYLGLEAEAAVGGGLGVRVAKVTEGSPAWKAGFKVGDRIKAIQGNAISNLDEMVEQLLTKKPGETVRFFVARGGRNLDLVAVLMDASLANRIASKVPPLAQEEPAWLGITVNDLTPSFRQQFGLSVFRGAAVTNVVPGSPAARAGIMAGDAIVEVVGRPVESADDLLMWVEQAKPGDVAQLIVARGFSVQPKVLTMESNPKTQPPMRFGNRTETQNVPPRQAASSLDLVPNTAKKAEATQNAEMLAQANAREQVLEREVASLQEELRATKQRLAETEKKLKDIAAALGRD